MRSAKVRTPKPRKPARLTRVSVVVTYNLGNYQNVRFDLHAEVPRGGSPKLAFLDLTAILCALKPVRNDFDTQRAIEVLKKTTDELTTYEKDHLAEFQEKAKAYAALKDRREWALNKLDELGGGSTYTDAKREWQDQDEELF